MISTYNEPRALGRLRKKCEGKLLALGMGAASHPVGIFTCFESAIWSIRHFGDFDPKNWWWVMLYDRDTLTKSPVTVSIPDEIVEYVCTKKLTP